MTAAPRVKLTHLGLIVAASLGLSLFFFSPALWLMREPAPGTFQWTRALGYLAQCDNPFRSDIEPALRWRVLPPLAAHGLGLRGLGALLLPWAGMIAATAYVAVLFRRRLDDHRWVFGGTLLFGTTAAVLVPTGWLGINDAWVWLALLAVAFGRARLVVPLACLLAPWVDERFIIGFPLAWLVRQHESGRPWRWTSLRDGLWLLPYTGFRLVYGLSTSDPVGLEKDFIAAAWANMPVVLAHAPIGWWMGLRAAWAPVIYGCAIGTARPFRHPITLVAGGTLLVSLMLASDISRSVAIITPLVLLGAFTWREARPHHAPATLLVIATANLLIPAAHVVYNKMALIYPLPIELFRLLR